MFKSNKQLKREAVFYAGVGAVLLVILMLQRLSISAGWELSLIFFGLGISFYLKFLLREEEKEQQE
ncbi:hypothetical protein QUF51_01190 [Bacillus pumilus]|nr:hypothetical protein [Bacillus pumilus]OLP65788.1 hypothetical protein BACPU_14060 [Bacillus pumilus]